MTNRWKMEDGKWKIQRGLSLIEILVVITVFAALGIIVTRSIILSLQGSQKSTGQVAIRENLDYATGVIERQLRNADSIVDCKDQPSNPLLLNYVDQNGNQTSFSCVTPGASGYIASGSANLRLTSPSISVTSCSITCHPDPSNITPAYVDISLTAQPANLTGAQNSVVTNTIRVYLRNY